MQIRPTKPVFYILSCKANVRIFLSFWFKEIILSNIFCFWKSDFKVSYKSFPIRLWLCTRFSTPSTICSAKVSITKVKSWQRPAEAKRYCSCSIRKNRRTWNAALSFFAKTLDFLDNNFLQATLNTRLTVNSYFYGNALRLISNTIKICFLIISVKWKTYGRI